MAMAIKPKVTVVAAPLANIAFPAVRFRIRVTLHLYFIISSSVGSIAAAQIL